MRAHLRAGIAIYNGGGYHAAHDAWEDHWLELEQGTQDEQFLHGLIQFTAAVHHATGANWSGATGLAESSRGYLSALPETHRGVDIGSVRRYLAALEADPECVERRAPLRLTHHGEPIGVADLSFDATAITATVLAEERGDDESVVERAIEYARRDLDDEVTGSPFVPLVFDFVRDPAHRGTILQRMAAHVEKRSTRRDDVSGLFEERE